MSLVVSLLNRLRLFFLEPGVPCGWGKFIWSSFILPSKTLVLYKVFHGIFLPINIFRINVCIYVLCVRFVKNMRNLFSIYFFECYNALHIWSWIRQIFLTSHYSNKDDLLSFIKSDGSPLVKLIKFVVITFSIWMIWRMRNYARF